MSIDTCGLRKQRHVAAAASEDTTLCRSENLIELLGIEGATCAAKIVEHVSV